MTKMFCYQCEQTANGTGCTQMGVCGKNPEVAAMQDLVRALVIGLSQYAHRARSLGKYCERLDFSTYEGLFATITNVNFDVNTLNTLCDRLAMEMSRAATLYTAACAENNLTPESLTCAAEIILPKTLEERLELAKAWSPEHRIEKFGPDIAGLYELIIDGIKGVGAYAYHAAELNVHDDAVAGYIHRALSTLAEGVTDPNVLLQLALDCGEINITVMALLDKANTSHYGHPEPTQVFLTPKRGKCILVSGHDLKILHELLKATDGMDINIYTHGEMLPANAYPELKKFKHLAGHYGTAWQNQRREFEQFPGPILMTTNCIQAPQKTYIDRIFTAGPVSFPGLKHLPEMQFKPLIDSAQACMGFLESVPEKTIMIGFAHNTVASVADVVLEAIKQGKIRHFFLIAGCDGAKPGRNYYTEFAEKVPKDAVILTLACGKFRFNTLDFGAIDGIPRLLDCGQCNDAYSAVQIATMLAGALNCTVNDLPLSFIISWYEQKATAVLLSLLYLGIQGIKLGPSLPAFLTPPLLNILVEKFKIAPIRTADEDLAECLAK